MVGYKIVYVILKGLSVVKELVIGFVFGLAVGGLWKMYYWNEQRKMRVFYDLFDKDEISVVVVEQQMSSSEIFFFNMKYF